MIPAFAFILLMMYGLNFLCKKHFWYVLVLSTLLLIPLIFMTMEFGQVNVNSASGARASDIPRDNIWAWIYYLKQIPHQFGWPTAVFSFTFIVVSITNHHWRLPKKGQITFLVWLLVGYFFFSAISLRDPRLNLSALLPLPILAVLALNRMLSNISQSYTTLAALFLALSNVGYTMAFRPVPYAQGYAEAARIVLEKSPNNSLILFSGQRDGSFIFNIRALSTTKNIGILRADKILLSLSIERSRGYKDRGFDENTIHDLLNHYAVHYVVAQSDFWIDIPSMLALQNLLRDSTRFELVQRISVKANYNTEDREISIYRNLGKVAVAPKPLSLEMVGIGRTFSNQKDK